MKVLTKAQVMQFLIAAEYSRYKALYHLAITTGMRFSELIGLKWIDIDWEKGTITVQRQLQYLPRKGYKFSEPKTRSGTRSTKLGEEIIKILNEHHRIYAHKNKSGENLMFTNGIGKMIYFKRFYKDFKRVLKIAELPEIRFHDLHHTAETFARRAAGSPKRSHSYVGQPFMADNIFLYCHSDRGASSCLISRFLLLSF